MKKIMRRWEAVLICMALLFSLFSLRTAEAKNEETLKTIFPVDRKSTRLNSSHSH